MSLSLLLGLSTLAVLAESRFLAAASIKLMECIGSICQIPVDPSDPLSAFWGYFNGLFPIVVGSAAGITLLWALFGGIEIMFAGADGAKLTAGKNKLLHSTYGLLLIAFSSMVLYMLNPAFFR